jgi:hypothetical protein
MSDDFWGWILRVLPFAAGPGLALVIGLVGLRHWKRTSALLIGAAVSQGGILFGYSHFLNVVEFLESQKLSMTEAVQATSLLFTAAGIVPMVLLLWAVFCDRKTPPAEAVSRLESD